MLSLRKRMRKVVPCRAKNATFTRSNFRTSSFPPQTGKYFCSGPLITKKEEVEAPTLWPWSGQSHPRRSSSAPALTAQVLCCKQIPFFTRAGEFKSIQPGAIASNPGVQLRWDGCMEFERKIMREFNAFRPADKQKVNARTKRFRAIAPVTENGTQNACWLFRVTTFAKNAEQV